jgi:hypothetical protein
MADSSLEILVMLGAGNRAVRGAPQFRCLGSSAIGGRDRRPLAQVGNGDKSREVVPCYVLLQYIVYLLGR